MAEYRLIPTQYRIVALITLYFWGWGFGRSFVGSIDLQWQCGRYNMSRASKRFVWPHQSAGLLLVRVNRTANFHQIGVSKSVETTCHPPTRFAQHRCRLRPLRHCQWYSRDFRKEASPIPFLRRQTVDTKEVNYSSMVDTRPKSRNRFRRKLYTKLY